MRRGPRQLVLLLAMPVAGCAVLGSWLGQQLGFRPSEFGVRIERGVSLWTSDGIALVSDVYHPKTVGRTPTILVRLPYDKTPTNTLVATVGGRMWAERGYTVVIQGTRGRYQSGGRHHPFLDERRDGIEALRWIASQPWFNGRIGMWGGSYFGYTQWAVADQVDPGPAALMIQISSTSHYGMFYPGGAFSLESALFWALRSRGERDERPPLTLLDRGFAGWPLIEADDRAVRDIPFYDDWVSHPTRDDFWRAVDGEERAVRVAAPVHLMAGWYDPYLPTQIDDFVRIRRDGGPEVAVASRLVIGPWAHAESVTFPAGPEPRNYRFESLAPSLPWFDRHLRDASAPDIQVAPVRIYVMGAHRWRDEQEWPLARARYTRFYLRSGGRANTLAGDGALAGTAPTADEPPDTYLYDPQRPVPSAGGAMMGPRAGIARQNAVETRPDVLVYTTPPLEDTEVTGPIQLILYVSTTAPSTDFTAKLVDVHPDGSAYNVSDGILRRRYDGPDRGPGTERPSEIRIDLWPTSMVFLRGHRIRLEISSSNYPRFDRNPNTGRTIATETRPIVAGQTVYHGPETPSRLVLPIIPGE